MPDPFTIDVSTLDKPHRQALEEVLGRQLAGSERLIVRIDENSFDEAHDPRPRQTLTDWAHVYEGLSEAEIEALDQITGTRANLTRDIF